MIRVRLSALSVFLLLLFVVAPVLATTLTSTNIALVPNATGRFYGAGTLPTSFSGMTFSNLDVTQVSASTLANYDTVVLNQVGDAGTCFTSQQKADINSWIYDGGKLIIYDSDACPAVDYSWLIYPFTTSNPGQLGSNSGTLTIVEENELSSNDPASPAYINAAELTSLTDAVGDANVMTSKDSHWYGDMEATNALLVTGWVHTYAEYGHGLLIYNGLDTDFDNNYWLVKIWQLELQKSWDPADLPGTHPVVAHKYWKGFLASEEELRFWTQMNIIAKASTNKYVSAYSTTGEVDALRWWTSVTSFALKIWGAVRKGYDDWFIAPLGEAFLTGFEFWELSQKGDQIIQAEKGIATADPAYSDALAKLEEQLDLIPQTEVEQGLWLSEYPGASDWTYEEWFAQGPRIRAVALLSSPSFVGTTTYNRFIATLDIELNLLVLK